MQDQKSCLLGKELSKWQQPKEQIVENYLSESEEQTACLGLQWQSEAQNDLRWELVTVRALAVPKKVYKNEHAPAVAAAASLLTAAVHDCEIHPTSHPEQLQSCNQGQRHFCFLFCYVLVVEAEAWPCSGSSVVEYVAGLTFDRDPAPEVRRYTVYHWVWQSFAKVLWYRQRTERTDLSRADPAAHGMLHCLNLYCLLS